jgi:DNA-nicking Smr family endonuclease
MSSQIRCILIITGKGKFGLSVLLEFLASWFKCSTARCVLRLAELDFNVP